MEQFDALRRGSHLTLLLGAGASAPSGLPDWDEFAVRVALASNVVGSREAAELLIAKQDPMLIMQAARQKAGAEWEAAISTALYGGDGSGAFTPTALHLSVAGRYSAAPDNTTLGTLNFDRLLERAIADDLQETVYSSTSESVGPNGVTVHHLHGVIDDDFIEDPVVSFADYAELLASPDAWQPDWLRQALEDGPLLIAGTTYRDPDLRQWMHTIMHKSPPQHAGIVTIVREGLGLSRDEFDMIDEALIAEWQSLGLTALALHDFTDIALVIRELEFAHLEGYRAPSERAAQLWTKHRVGLKTLQPEYAGQLERDTALIGEATGTNAHRGTLWLAAAGGKLARWASSSTEYLDVRTMKRVPAGHDSPWIAGEAMGSERPKVKDIARDGRVTPHWRSALAIPIVVGDGRLPSFASAVLTFGLSSPAIAMWERQTTWEPVARQLSEEWGTRLSGIAFPR